MLKVKTTRQNSKLFDDVYRVVQKIPPGKVMTYGQVANKLKDKYIKLKTRITPRYVGYILHANSDSEKIPCHRVVDRNGKIANNYAFGGWREQKKKLIKEGVKFKDKNHVDRSSFVI